MVPEIVPAHLPAFQVVQLQRLAVVDIAVIVSSSITQSRSTINGNVPEIAIVHTDPGYDGDPSHPGTGTITGFICPYP